MWRARDPVIQARERCVRDGLDPEALEDLEREVAEEIRDAVAFAESSPAPTPADVYRDGDVTYEVRR